jgi:hypothetical protein
MNVKQLLEAFEDTCHALDNLRDELCEVCEVAPDIFSKPPRDLSASDALKVAHSILKLKGEIK